MAEISWIKLNINIFDDEKMKLIDGLPENDAIFRIWIYLLSLAGKTNDSGLVYLSNHIPYTEEMIAALCNRPISTVRLALKTFKDFGMIEIFDDKLIAISNWEKHQNIDGLEKIREQNRLRKQAQRERQALSGGHVTSRDSHATEEDKNKNKNKNKNSILSSNLDDVKEILSYLNKKAGTSYRASSKKTQSLVKARFAEGYNLDDFKKVIDNKAISWKNTEWEKYLRPETLFSPKFEGYLNEKPIVNSKKAFETGYDEDLGF